MPQLLGPIIVIFAHMDFEEYLKSKKINSESFKKSDLKLWTELSQLFQKMHPKSFTSQKLFLINPIRRKYPLSKELSQEKQSVKPKPKPKIKPRPTKKSEETAAKKPAISKVKPKIKVKPKPIIKKPKIK